MSQRPSMSMFATRQDYERAVAQRDLDPHKDEDALKQINRLAFENGRMRFLIGEAITTMNHAQTFIRTREKMHRTGIDLWCELVNRLQECLNDQEKDADV